MRLVLTGPNGMAGLTEPNGRGIAWNMASQYYQVKIRQTAGYWACRQILSLRDADAALLRACAFLQGDASLAVGCHGGSMQVLSIRTGELLSASDSSHSSPINQIRVRLLLHMPWGCK